MSKISRRKLITTGLLAALNLTGIALHSVQGHYDVIVDWVLRRRGG